MAAVKQFKVAALPGILEPDSIYWVKGASDAAYKVYVTTSASVAVPIDAVTSASLALALSTKENTIAPGTTGQYYSWDKTWRDLNKAAVGLGNVDNTPDSSKPVSTPQQAALDLKANDNAVVKLTGNQTVAGVKAFTSSPTVPTPTSASDAANKSYVDTGDNGLQTQINALTSVVNNGVKVPVPIDCSTNPNYPASTKGDAYRVQVAGFIGGASGKPVNVNDTIVCLVTSASGNEAAVGANFYVQEGNQDAATETVPGWIRKATQVEANGGTSDVGAMTPLKTHVKIDGMAVRYDAAQTLTTGQKNQALANLGAAALSNVMLLTTDQIAAGIKTFTSAPKLSIGTATTAANYLLLEPSDYGVGKPRFQIQKSSTANVWHMIISDSATSTGTIDFISTGLTWNSQTIATQTWATGQFSALGHTHTFASLTSKPTTIAGFGITDAYTKTEVNTLTSWYATEW